MSKILEFFNHMDNFKDQILKLLIIMDRNSDAELLNTKYLYLINFRKVNAHEVIKMFHEHVVIKYCNEIKNRDESFFLGKVNEIKGHIKEEEHIEIIDQIKIIWTELDNDNKNNIWKYILILSLLSDQVMNTHYIK